MTSTTTVAAKGAMSRSQHHPGLSTTPHPFCSIATGPTTPEETTPCAQPRPPQHPSSQPPIISIAATRKAMRRILLVDNHRPYPINLSQPMTTDDGRTPTVLPHAP